MSRAIRQADVQRAVSGAIKGGMAPGSFRVRVDAERGVIDLLPTLLVDKETAPTRVMSVL